jgi:glucan 1,3-beta-glucosidase
MHLHSLIGILAATASHVVAEPIPSLPPHSLSSTSASHFRSKSLGISAFLPPIEDKPELLARSEPEPAPYWLEEIKHQGISAFHPNPNSYQVFRNVKDFGAKGTSI